MDDPFAIQKIFDEKSVHGSHGHFFSNTKGHEIKDFFQSPLKKKTYLGLSINLRILSLINYLIIFVIGIFVLRSLYLQFLKGGYYHELAEDNRIRIETLYPQRGLIFDRNNIQLVQNVPKIILALRPEALPNDENNRSIILNELQKYVSHEVLNEALESTKINSWIPLKENLDHDEAIFFAAKFSDIPSLAVKYVTRRRYLNNDALSLSHILGYTGKLTSDEFEEKKDIYPFDARIGKSGLEFIYEDVLRGTFGRKQIEVDALGREKEIIAREESIAGKNLILTLDAELQKKSEEVLVDYLTRTQKKRGVIIILNPQSGDVLTMVSWPSVDGNLFETGLTREEYSNLLNDGDNPLFNRAAAGTYPSGSTIKPVFAAGALEDDIITTRTTFNSTGGIYVGSWSFPDWKAGGHGLTNVYKAIAESVNTFFYIIGGGNDTFRGLGEDGLAKWASNFGFGQRTNIDLPNEAAGFIPTREWKESERNEPWYIGDTYHFAIGQGDFLITPIQLAVATSAIANGGTRFRPHFIQSIEDSVSGKINIKPEILSKNFISEESLEIVKDGMRQTVTSGSARFLSTFNISVAGKTGTAEWNSNKDPHAWFTGFAPALNPEIVITVLVEEGREGSSIAVPIAKDILSWYFNDNRE